MKLSVIIPIYNTEKYLSRCLDSIQKQSFVDFECIMVNDGSTDSSKHICQEYQKDSRFILFNQQNSGQAVAKNLGLKKSRGDYVVFVDSDDWIDEEMFINMINILETTDSDIVCCDYCLVSAEKKIIQPKLKIKTLSQNEAIIEFLKSGNRGEKNNYSSCNKIYKKGIFEGVEFPQGRLYDDMSFSSKIFLAANKVSFTNQIYYYYFQNNTSVTRNSLSDRTLDLLSETESMVNLFSHSSKKIKRLVKNIHTRSYFSLLIKLCKSQNYPKDIYTDVIITNWTRILRKNFWEMMFSSMNTARKIIYAVLCVNYKLVIKIWKAYERL